MEFAYFIFASSSYASNEGGLFGVQSIFDYQRVELINRTINDGVHREWDVHLCTHRFVMSQTSGGCLCSLQVNPLRHYAKTLISLGELFQSMS